MSKRRYMVRRVTVLVAVALLVAGAVRVVAAVTSGGSSEAASEPPATSAGAPQPEPTESTGPGSTEPDVTAAPTTEPVGPVPTPAEPARLYIAGDSASGTFGPYLERLMDLTGIVDSTLDYKVSSGLTRPDFFDWPARLREQMAVVDPDIVVITFGGNDAQNIRVGERSFDVPRPEWTEEYRRRVGEAIDIVSEGGRTVIWVGIPNASSESFTERLVVQRDAVVAELAEWPHVQYVDTWERFSGRNGGYADYVIDPRDGVGKKVRASDGFHLNVAGAEILALDIAEVIRNDLRARGAIL